MTKYLTTIKNKDEYLKIKDMIHGLILGVENFSVNFPFNFSFSELKEMISLLKEDGKEIFVSLNKNMHAKDLEELELLMKELNQLEITGILYYDIALVQIKEEQQLTVPLVWAQEHLTTNYLTCNYWKDFGADYTYLSGEITIPEILEIRKSTDVKLILPIFGRLPMFTSRRHLVKNYLNYFDLPKDDQEYQIYKEGNHYPISDNELGTVVYSAHYLNGLKESILFENEGIDYFYLNPVGIEFSTFQKILKCYVTVSEEHVEDFEKEINEWLEGNTDKGFFYKETVYKVIS